MISSFHSLSVSLFLQARASLRIWTLFNAFWHPLCSECAACLSCTSMLLRSFQPFASISPWPVLIWVASTSLAEVGRCGDANYCVWRSFYFVELDTLSDWLRLPFSVLQNYRLVWTSSSFDSHYLESLVWSVGTRWLSSSSCASHALSFFVPSISHQFQRVTVWCLCLPWTSLTWAFHLHLVGTYLCSFEDSFPSRQGSSTTTRCTNVDQVAPFPLCSCKPRSRSVVVSHEL